MDKYTIAPPAGSTNNSVGAADRPWKEGHFDSVKLNGGDLGEYLAESTGYGIVSGCEPTISGLTVTVGAGIVHLADGTRKEISASTVNLATADITNPRIDNIYINANGVVAAQKGVAAQNPNAPDIPVNTISVCTVYIAANSSAGVITQQYLRKIGFAMNFGFAAYDTEEKFVNYGIPTIELYPQIGCYRMILCITIDSNFAITSFYRNLVRRTIEKCEEIGVMVETLKFHCEEDSLATSSANQTKYINEIKNMVAEVKTYYNKFSRIVILNERGDIYGRSSNATQNTFAVNAVQEIKTLGYRVGISFAHVTKYGPLEVHTICPELLEELDFFGVNVYPVIGGARQNTTLRDSIDAWTTPLGEIKYLKYLYPEKEVVISETGIYDYYDSLLAPADWTINTLQYTHLDTVDMFYYGLFTSPELKYLVSEVWQLYNDHFRRDPNKAIVLFNKYLKGGFVK